MSWGKVKIGDVAEILPGFAFKSSELGDDGTPLIKIGNILDSGQVDTVNVQRLPQTYYLKKHEKYRLADRDIVIAMTGATAGKVGRIHASEGEVFLLNQRVAKFVPREIDPDFLWFAIGSEQYRAKFYALGGGAAQPNMSGPQIASVEIPLPDLPTQQRIAGILSAYDDLIENNRRRIGLLEQAARLLYREWFVHLRFPGHETAKIVDGLPEGWTQTTVFDAVDVLSGGTPKTDNAEYWGDQIPFFTPKDTGEFPYVNDTEKMITEAGLKNCNSRLYEKDTLFITARGTVGKLRLAQRPMAMNQSCYALRSKCKLTQHHLFFAISDRVNHLKAQAGGAVFAAIVVDTFKKIPLLIPSDELAEEFARFASNALAQIDALAQQNAKLTRARDLLLPRLMDGRIPV